MKKVLAGLALALPMSLFIACDDVNDLVPEIDIQLNQKITQNFIIPPGDSTFTITDSQELEAIEDLQEYSDNLTDVKVDSVTYSFSNLTGGNAGTGSDATFEGTVVVNTVIGTSTLGLINNQIAANDGGQVSLELLISQGEKTVQGTEADNLVTLFNTLATTGAVVNFTVNGAAANNAGEAYGVDLTYTIYGTATAQP